MTAIKTQAGVVYPITMLAKEWGIRSQTLREILKKRRTKTHKVPGGCGRGLHEAERREIAKILKIDQAETRIA